MFSIKLSLRLLMAIVFTVAILVVFIKCNTARRVASSAQLSTGVGSSGGITHKTWTQYGGGADQSKYLDLKQITKQNVNHLQVAWSYSTDDNISSYRFNPLVVDNVMYVPAKNNSLVAVDITSGKEIWIHSNLTIQSRRGLSYWESKDRNDRRLLFCVNNTLQEIDARTGKSIPTFGTNGYVDLRQNLGRDPATIGRATPTTPAPVFEDLILMGSSPGEAYFSAPGHIRAYNVITGKLAWVFHTIPHPGEFGYETWPKDAYKYIGGVNSWGEITIDEKRGIAYFPLGSPTYDYYGGDREGAGLFGNSLVALDARTGKRLWHFQTVHHDLWDFDIAAAPQLVTVKHNGEQIDAVAIATKQGFLFAFNRVTGEPLWPVEERPVPASGMPGEKSWPTQPFPTVLAPFARQKVTVADVNPHLPKDKLEEARKRIAAAKSDLFYPLSDKYETITMPGANGGAIFGNTAANPPKGRVYVAEQDKPSFYKLKKEEPAALAQAMSANDTVRAKGRYIQYCQACHGANRTGAVGPSLVNVNRRLAYDNFHTVVSNGRAQMPAFPDIQEQAIIDLYKYLSDERGRQGRGAINPMAQSGETRKLSGPVVASGGAPLPSQIQKSSGYGFTDGLKSYPEGSNAPKIRYVDGSTTPWGLGHADLVGPPWSSIVAYDLNTGKILWKRAHGKDDKLSGPETGLPSGIQGKGMVVTSTGLLFATSQDGRIYAYDEDNGKELWSAMLPRVPEGIPSMFEYDGQQYLVVGATGAAIDKSKPEAEVPRGYVVFSLPRKK
ncbi:MAG: Quinoprotein glucose dehydrogenase [Segetibacter sp.]|jgi:quinoprotein glucose dehydrogenase|nr:Quinoprotein glucose dehydrogenase [Segetibacter sp.]